MGEKEGEGDGDQSGVIITKVISMVILGGTSFICGLLPMVLSNLYDKKTGDRSLRSEQKREKITSVLLAFTGGVLLCTVFIHLLPEVGEVFEDLLKTPKYENLPEFTPQLLLCIGFFIMYLVEEVAHKLMHSSSDTSSHCDPQVEMRSTCRTYTNNNNNGVSNESRAQFMENVVAITEEATKNLTFQERQHIIGLIREATSDGNNNDHGPRSKLSDTGSPIRDHLRAGGDEMHEMEFIRSTSGKGSSSVTSFLLALALSVHAIFEGMAIGLENTASAIWLMMLGVGAHKIVLSVCMGIEMVAGKVRRTAQIFYVTMFAVVTPIGIAIGLVISAEQEVAAALCQGIASGTLLYVLFYEVLARSPPTGGGGQSGLLSFLAILIGFLLMFLLQIFADFD